jgi:hypothetical protein
MLNWIQERATVTTHDFCGEDVWGNNNFDSNICRMLSGGDCWRVRETLTLIEIVVKTAFPPLIVSLQFFNSLASIIVQPVLSSLDKDEEINWVYLISNNQKKEIDHGILRLINSFLYSRKVKTSINLSALTIIDVLTDTEYCDEKNLFHFANAPNIPKALVQILIEENENTDIVNVCLIILILFTLVRRNFVICGICEAIMPILRIYAFDKDKIDNLILLILHISDYPRNIPRLITAGLLEALVQIFNSPIFEKVFHEPYQDLVKHLCAHNKQVPLEFHNLGISEGSNFFD